MRNKRLNFLRRPANAIIGMAAIVLPLLAGCAAQDGPQGKGADAGYDVVHVSFAYTPDDKSTHQWRALLAALDDCHMQGYQNAQPVRAPDTVCEQMTAGNCSRFRATASYDCIGMGYQPN